MNAPNPALVRERYEAVRESIPGIVARANALVSAVEELILEVSPEAVIERRVDLLPPHEVRPDLLVNGKLAVWVSSNRLIDTWKGMDRDALVLKKAKLSRRYATAAVVYDISAGGDRRSGSAAARTAQRFGSGMAVYSARDLYQMAEFIKRVKKVLAT